MLLICLLCILFGIIALYDSHLLVGICLILIGVIICVLNNRNGFSGGGFSDGCGGCGGCGGGD